jgi:3'-phosphoadenosine 5'-phosphosulfate sulfotransferase (PAPS reductase)/FAD synthetase
MAVMTVDLCAYDLILLNSSGGKDSQAMLDVVVGRARGAGVTARLVVAHADLGRMEWPGTRQLVEAQAAHYGLRCEVVRREITGPDGQRRPQDLLAHIEARGKFPDAARRFCTSDHKRGPIQRLITSLVRELDLGRQARVLNVMGMRAQESPARAKRPSFRTPAYGSSSVRLIDEWLPLHDWDVAEVWQCIKWAGTPVHPAYALGMPRLSCRFCILASRTALVRSAQLNPDLAAEYVAVEERIGHRFQDGRSMRDIVTEAATADVGAIDGWAA